MIFPLNLFHDINEFFEKYGDPRVANWTLMSSPFYTIGICLSYAYIVKVLGPRIMKNRSPFRLKNTLFLYNLFQIILSVYLFYEIGMSGWFTREYSLRCQPVDYSDNPKAIRMMNAARLYYLAKITELMDTIFFVLRKKFDQITTLHVIHHGIMPLSVWLGLKIVPGGHATWFGLLNSFVHIFVYGYYFLSGLGPKIQKYLWWKKYLTTLQMMSFIGIVVHSFQLFFTKCHFPIAFAWFIGLHGLLFFYLFIDYYKKVYGKKLK